MPIGDKLCSRCGARVFPDEKNCPECGEELLWASSEIRQKISPPSFLPPAEEDLLIPPSSVMQQAAGLGQSSPDSRQQMSCPHCGSESTVTYQMAHLSGTSTGNLSGLTYFLGGGLGGFGGETKQQTKLAAITDPPRPPSFTNALVIVGGIFIFLFFCGLAQSLLILISGAVGLCLLRIKFYQAEKVQYEEAMEIWRRSAICLRCGHCWVIH